MATIQVKDLTKHYRQGQETIRALDGVSLFIDEGEFVSVVGRSGSGKTTFLDLVGLLLRPSSGAIELDGVDVSSLRGGELADIRGERIGFVFQEYNLLSGLNAVENVLLPLRYSNRKRRGREHALDLLAEVGLADRSKHRPDQLSGGQQQRVAIARALVNDPSLILADEPTGSVDTEVAAELVRLLRRLAEERRVTIVVVTHDLDLAAQTDRIIRLKDGRVISDAPARELVAV
jgi:putative ABC transport system ATP-binding protein